MWRGTGLDCLCEVNEIFEVYYYSQQSSKLVIICVVLLLFVLFCCYLCCSMYCLCGPGSSVGIATDYGLDGPGSNPGGDEIFPPLQAGPVAHPASSKMGTRCFLGVKCSRGVLLTIHRLLVPRSWKSRAIPLPTLWATPGL
jgi:hypothetical protein